MADPLRADPAMYLRVFEGHHEGRVVLEDLLRRFARPAVLEGGIDAVLKTYDRNGSRKVVEFIVSMINQAQGVNSPTDEDVQA